MENPGSKTANFRFSHQGMASKESPDLLKDGRYRKLSGVYSLQEGALSSRTGSKLIGSLGVGASPCNVIRKLTVTPTEDPLVPSTNPRYLDINGNICRTYDYKTAAVVASSVEGVGKHWEMAAYAAGETGQPFGFFACPNAMLKDSGATPQSPLPTWGTPPSAGVAQAVCVAAPTPTPLSPAIAINYIYTNWPTWGGVVIVLNSAPQAQTPSVPMVDNSTVTIAGVSGITFTTTDGRTNPNDTWDIRVGVVDADGVTIDNPTTMFRIFDSNGQMVTASGSYASGGTITHIGSPNGLAIGMLDGGADASPNGSTPYDYRWTGVSGLTGNEGNPSQVMLSDASFALGHGLGQSVGAPLAINLGQATVTVWGSPDADITTLNIYRRGGILYDTWRLVGSVDNPGVDGFTGKPNPQTFVDNTSDADLVYANQLQLDNDMPVTSTVPVPYSSTISAPGGLFYAGWMATVSLAGLPAAYNLTPGTLAHISSDSAASGSEDCIIEAINGATITVYFQYAHADGDTISVDAIAGQPCNLAANVGDCVVVAGDPNNPHMLYKSKSGSPESFPVGADAAGAVTNIGAGTPSNGIVNLCEFRGQLACMNVSALFEVPVIMGSLLTPTRVADKGLVAQSAWCKTETELWYLSTDGVWSWDGGSLRKRTEAIDPIFHSMEVNGIPPISMQPSALASARMEYRRGMVRLLYKDINNVARELACEPSYGDRWDLYPEAYAPFTAISTLYTEPDTQSLILALASDADGATFVIADAVNIAAGTNQTADGWVDPFSAGAAIPYDIWLPWFDLGLPNAKKLFEEIWLDVDPQLYTSAPIPSMTVEILLDYSDVAVDSVVVTIPSGTSLAGRQPVALLANVVSKAAGLQSFGREARAISFHLYGQAYPIQATFYSLMFQYQETGLLTAGGTTDWMDLEHPFDKKLYQMTVTFDTEGTDRTIVLDTISGKDGKTYNEAVQRFVLSNPTIIGAGRAKKSFPVTDGTIAKLVRVRPIATVGAAGQSSTAFFKIRSVEFQKEPYPADVTSFTPWEDGGTPYLKYANQVVLEVNTNGAAVECRLQADNATKFTFTVTSTEADRQRNITVPTGVTGYRWRLFVDLNQAAIATGAGVWQLFNHSIKFQQADKGEVGHTFDWDDLGYPYDKCLRTVDVEWDNASGADVTLQFDTLSGVNGQTVNSAVSTFVLSGGRSKRQFPLPANTIAKMVRLYPAGGTIPEGFKQWKYIFDKEEYPADIVLSTTWEDGGTPYLKYANQVALEVNTNGVAVECFLQADNVTKFKFTVTSTEPDRQRNITVPAGITGYRWRLLIDPNQPAFSSREGMWQLFNHSIKFQQADRGEVGHTFDWDDLGHPYDKYLRAVTIEWDNTSGADVILQLDTLSGIDGQTVAPAVGTFVLSGGRSKKEFPLPVNTIAKMIRLYPEGNTIPVGFKQWKYLFDKEDYPADIILSTPWKDATSPNDKNPSWLYIDADTNSVPAAIILQNENGTAFTCNHTGSSTNRKANYPIPADVYGKMWRLLLTPGTNGKAQVFNWGFERWQPTDQASGVDPIQVVLWTPWSDQGWPYGTIARNLILTINTGGVACAVGLQNESGTMQTFPVTTTYENRRVVLPCNSNLIGKMWRLLLAPEGYEGVEVNGSLISCGDDISVNGSTPQSSSTGLAQLWNWTMEVVKEPPEVSHWDSYQIALGYAAWKYMKQAFLEYQCAGEITVQFVSDTGVYSVTLPAHPTRSSERFYLPVVWGNGLNKSKLYEMIVDSVTAVDPFKLYAEASWVEWIPLGGDRHAAYQKTPVSEFVTMAI